MKILGQKAESLIAQDNEEIKETKQRLIKAERQLKESEKIAEELQKNVQEVEDLRSKIEQTQARIDALEQEHGSSLENENRVAKTEATEKEFAKRF